MARLGNRSREAALGCLIVASGILLGACATKPPASDPIALAEYKRVNDPLEPLNRATHDMNMTFDRHLFKPVAKAYRAVLPARIRTMIGNFISNLSEPFIFANTLLQGQFHQSGKTFARFVTNSTLGVGGLFEVAADFDLEHYHTDFGETLGIWGIGEGPYLVLPLVGPSNPRDGIGFAARVFADPITLYLKSENKNYLSWARDGVELVDYRARHLDSLDELERNSTDFYASLRSAYRQNRAYKINRVRGINTEEQDSIFNEELQ